MNEKLPPRIKPKIKAAPKIRQVYWCKFWDDAILPEMWKERPVLIISGNNVLNGHCAVLPMSTQPQKGYSERWAHKLSFRPDGEEDTWVVCNHLCTVSTGRLSQFRGNAIPRLDGDEFNTILAIMYKRLPVPQG
ncbi:MAG: type II toxin-antitoxin system PemK/MazF family toxin [Alphaproteobacteria bacterium]|nr:type II toxin-antitoxin system PemK/MazF family toxin [Alphaproteobacteria bacterium]MBL6954993.1 type II toxin-antitoxin system PemK/MazF family toxin [Alphaproteobacteria bacterium]